MSSDEIELFKLSAPGKVILFGEHAVVYGKLAIAASVDQRCWMTVRSCHDNQVVLDLEDISVKCRWTLQQLQAMKSQEDGSKSNKEEQTNGVNHVSVTAFLHLYLTLAKSTQTWPSLEISCKSDLPIGSGLGSSASFSVCLSAALLLLYKQISRPNLLVGNSEPRYSWSEENLSIINKWAYEVEKIFHGNPSGIDNSVATYGGAVTFLSGKSETVSNMPNLKIILINTKVGRSTKALVQGVRDKREKFPDIINPVLESIDAIGKESVKILSKIASNPQQRTLYESLMEMIRMNQLQLKVLGVSHPSLDTICQSCEDLGLAAKLTGAGGGGCAYCLIPPDLMSRKIDELKKKLGDTGYSCYDTAVGVPGLICHALEHQEISSVHCQGE